MLEEEGSYSQLRSGGQQERKRYATCYACHWYCLVLLSHHSISCAPTPPTNLLSSLLPTIDPLTLPGHRGALPHPVRPAIFTPSLSSLHHHQHSS